MRSLIWPLGWKPIYWIPIIVLLLGACAVFENTPTPETPREQLAVLEITYQNANLAIQDLVVSGTLHGEAASHVAEALVAVQVALRAVRVGVDGVDAVELLNAANKALIELTARLQAEEAQ